MKLLFKFFIIITFFISCSSDDNEELNCNVAQPLEELAWLKSEIKKLQNSGNKSFISQASYKNQTVFIFSLCCHSCDVAPAVYNCSGEKINNIGGDNGVSWDDISNEKQIWESEGECL